MNTKGRLMKLVESFYKSRQDERITDKRLIVGHPKINHEKGWDHELISRSHLLMDMQTNPIQHEAIYAKEPCRVFLDIESEKPMEEAEIEAQNTISRVVERIQQYKGRGEYVIFDSSRPGTYSIHVIFYHDWVSSPRVLHKLTEGITGIDKLPYHSPERETPSFLRFPYSKKIGNVNGIQVVQNTIRCLPRGGPREFNEEWFLKGCVSIGMLDPPTTILNIPEPEARSPSELPPPGMFRAVKLIIDEMCTLLPKVDRISPPRFYEGREWSVTISPGQYCREHKHKTGTGYHKSNGSVMRMIVNKYEEHKIYIKCLDDECDGMVTLFPVDFRDLYMKGLEHSEGDIEEETQPKKRTKSQA